MKVPQRNVVYWIYMNQKLSSGLISEFAIDLFENEQWEHRVIYLYLYGLASEHQIAR